MSAPARRRPGSESPIRLTPVVEEVRTSPTVESAAAAQLAAEPPTIAATAPTPPAPVAPVAEITSSDEKKAVTFGLRTSLKKRAETAVLRTAPLEGGYPSMAALMEGALERELERLANEFNDGVPFPRNAGNFRQGRPLGS